MSAKSGQIRTRGEGHQQLEIKIMSSHSRFQKLQIDKQKTQRYLKLCNYQYCCISWIPTLRPVKSFICKKHLKQRNKKVCLTLTCYSLESLLISRYRLILDYRKREYHYNCPLFTVRSTSQGIKYRLFSSKNRISAVKLTITNLHWEVLKNMKNGTQQRFDNI